ncbi:MAG: biotin/lipoyl-containing protein [Bryobacteraceae bacterium]
MKLEIRAGRAGSGKGKAEPRMMDVTREGSRVTAAFAGGILEADAVEVAPGVYSVLLRNRSFEVRVEPGARPGSLRVCSGNREIKVEIADPRAWRGRHGGVLEAEGRQEIAAPMPGKIVRILARQGGKVEAGEGLFVIEAMKMQNEIRSPKTGTVERLLVREGQAVNSGEPLAVIV